MAKILGIGSNKSYLTEPTMSYIVNTTKVLFRKNNQDFI